MCQEDTEGEIKREQTQEQRTEKDSMYELSAKNDRLMSDIVNGKMTDAQLKTSISLIIQMMQKYYGKQVILLIDLIRGILSAALKDNTALKFAILTGCLKITKESIFTGTNNFTTDTISDRRYNEYFGFTHKEVEKLLQDAEMENKLELVQQWYDGYHFGDMDIYCPWDVLNYVKKVLEQGLEKPENFWEHTSDNAVIEQFLEKTDFDVTEKFETLLSGNYIKETISENLTYNFLASSEENLWSLLYMTGYLTKVKPEDMEKDDKLEEGRQLFEFPMQRSQIFSEKVLWNGFIKKL